MSGRRHRRSRPRPSPGRTRTGALVAALAAAVLAAGSLATAPTAAAADACTSTWAGGSGAWTDPARWSPVGVPDGDAAVCIGHAAGAPSTVVRVGSSVAAGAVTLTGATLSIARSTTFDADRITATHAAITGGGVLAVQLGIAALTDTRLDGVQAYVPGRLQLGGRMTMTGGAAVQNGLVGTVDLLPGLRLVDGDGNPGNRLQVSRFPLYLSGRIFLGVRLALVNTALLSQGDVTLAALDNLDPDGVLRPVAGTRTVQIGSANGGVLRLPRSVTGVARGATVDADDIVTRTGEDAFSDLRTVDGTVYLTRPLFLGGALTVRGRFSSSSSVGATTIGVNRGASFTADRVDGELRSGGTAYLAGAHMGRLTLLAGSRTVTDLTAPLVVAGRAELAGALTVQLGSGDLPATGTRLVLLTAAGGVTGTFAGVATDQPDQAGVSPGYRPTWVTGTLTAPVG